METPMSNIITTGDLGGQKVKMRIDENALAHIMSVLTDLYSDPQMAVIREYSTNARDSHIEAGNDAPIEILTPSPLSPYFKIIDHGIGLSVQDITEMYSLYGASTKRGTNEQTGMLGLGAKSALTLVPQFNLTCVKNGVKAFVSVSRAQDGSGQMEIIDTKSTTDPNGVEISIPIPRNDGFARKVKDFFKFWPKGTVLVDGKEPEPIDGLWVNDKIVVDKTLNKDYVVMGNVAYPVSDGLWGGGYYYSHMGIVAFVEIGEVNFTPSREQLHYTPTTKATIARIKREVMDGVAAAAQKAVNGAKDSTEAWVLAREWRNSFRGAHLDRLTYKGAVVPGDLPVSEILDTQNAKHRVVDLFARGRRNWSTLYALTPDLLSNHMFITGFNATLKMSPVQRERAQKYAEQQGWSVGKAFITYAQSFKAIPSWVTGLKVAKWEDIAKVKIERAQSTRAVRTDPYDLYEGNYYYTSVATLDTKKDIIFISPAEDKTPSFLRKMFPDAQIVMLGMNRWDKFKRDFPTAMYYKDKIDKTKAGFLKNLTEDDKFLWHYLGSYRYTFDKWDASRIDDPELRHFIELMDGKHQLSPAAVALRAMPSTAGTKDVPCPANPLSKYPLAGSLSRSDLEHGYWYLNTYFAYLNEKEN